MKNKTSTSLYPHEAVELLRQLIQFNTTNPPGDEQECILHLNKLLMDQGIQTKLLASNDKRPNLVARIPGAGSAPPLLMYGHVDVVTTAGQAWTHPPFQAATADGFIWGRGALDMKGGVAMMTAAFIRARAQNLKPSGDIILAVVSDEEAGGNMGAKFLVEEHPGLFEYVKYAIGEFGAFSLVLGGKRFYPIQIAEKQICWMKATFRGPGGHGSLPVKGGAMAKLADFLRRLDSKQLPAHITPPARMMFSAIASEIGGGQGWILNQILNPQLTHLILRLLGDQGRLFSPLLHHTASPTILEGSDKVNVIPGEVSVELDGRLLPGYVPEDLIRELREATGRDQEIEVVQHDPGPTEPDLGMFDLLKNVLLEADPEGIPVPLLLSGVTDARFFSRLGIQTYGFTPMRLPEDFVFTNTIHAADERIPVDALRFGSDAIYRVLEQFGTG